MIAETAANLRRRQKWAVCFLLLLAIGEFSFRGPVRAFHQSNFNDFISPFIQTNVWLSGEDPYDPQVFARFWPPEAKPPDFVRRESRDGSLPARRGIPSPYPPTAFPLLTPFALLHWFVAIRLWILATLAAFGIVVYNLIVLAKIQPADRKTIFVVIAALMLAPFHTVIAVSNIVLVVYALGFLAVMRTEQQRYISSGFFLAAAIGLKPTAALCFLIYCAFRRRGAWRVVPPTLAGCFVLFSLADGRMLVAGAHWVGSYLLNTHRMFAAGAINDYDSANPARFDLLNLQLAFFPLFRSRLGANVFAWLVACMGFGCWISSLRQRMLKTDELLNLAILATITLLPFYHRFTDGCILLPAVVWSIRELGRSRTFIARAILALAVPFLVPGAAALQSFVSSNARIGILAQNWWWQSFIAPYQVWLILAISVLLLFAQQGTSNSAA